VQLVSAKSAEKWAEAIRKHADKDKSLTAAQAEQKYLEVVRQWSLYGACCFNATVRPHPTTPRSCVVRRVSCRVLARHLIMINRGYKRTARLR
jgi:uncharacterized protein YprB with RNaseH-like and TPR domain